jgi:hypothetical protein
MAEDEYGEALEQSLPVRTGPRWEDDGPALARFVDTARGVLLEPAATFSNMRREGGLGPPLLYGIIGVAVGSLTGLLLQMATPFGFPAGASDIRSPVPVFLLLPLLVVTIPCIGIVGLFLASGIYHVILLLLGGARYGFETTFRVVAYASGSTSPLGVIPFCGGIIGGVWGIVVTIIGLARAHETSTGKAAAAVLLPIAACCVLAVIFSAALVAVFIGAARDLNR